MKFGLIVLALGLAILSLAFLVYAKGERGLFGNILCGLAGGWIGSGLVIVVAEWRRWR